MQNGDFELTLFCIIAFMLQRHKESFYWTGPIKLAVRANERTDWILQFQCFSLQFKYNKVTFYNQIDRT